MQVYIYLITIVLTQGEKSRSKQPISPCSPNFDFCLDLGHIPFI